MNTLTKIVRTASPSAGVQFRAEAYGRAGVREFLRDVIAMANAAVDGLRYIVVGAGFDAGGQKVIHGVDPDDFMGKPSYQSLVADYVEPPIRIRYMPVSIDDRTVGVFEIGDCQDRPYMMRIDLSETLRRGDAYVRIKDTAVKSGRRQLQQMFEAKFRDSVSADRIEVGFPGEIIHKRLRVATADLSNLPSAVAGAKLRQMAEIRRKSRDSGSGTMVVRLTHARLFGADSPYEMRTAEELQREMTEIEHKHRLEDEHFLFEEHAQKIQLVIYNQGEEEIEDATLSLLMPNHHAFYIAHRLPRRVSNGRFSDSPPPEQVDYPVVNLKDETIQVSVNLGQIPAGEPVNAFRVPLRLCAGSQLRGRKIGVRYTLYGRNLRAPAQGVLRLLF